MKTKRKADDRCESTAADATLDSRQTESLILTPAIADETSECNDPYSLPGGQGPLALLVEDQSYARRSGRNALESLGYQVMALGNGAEALAVLPSCAGRLTCVVLDLSLSDMDGADLFCRLRDLMPNLPVLLACGEATREQLKRIDMDAFTSLLCKPYRTDNISRRLLTLPTTLKAEPLS
jgi:CheY-like chemotaxis protein